MDNGEFISEITLVVDVDRQGFTIMGIRFYGIDALNSIAVTKRLRELDIQAVICNFGWRVMERLT